MNNEVVKSREEIINDLKKGMEAILYLKENPNALIKGKVFGEMGDIGVLTPDEIEKIENIVKNECFNIFSGVDRIESVSAGFDTHHFNKDGSYID